MAQRSLLRPYQLDSNGSYSFAQLIIDGYSGGDLEDGYLTGLIFQDRANGGATRLELHADDGEINQTGSGNVTFTGNVEMKANAVVQGDFTVNGTTTYVNTEQMLVTDPITVLNVSGSEALSSWTGLTMRDADGYNRIGWTFDGYWGLSTSYDANSDLIPDRAIAYIAAGDSYGDLSSTAAGDSGASKIGVDDSGVVTGDDVQEALENIFGGNADISGTPHVSWHVNNDADASTDEDPCLLMSGGDGVALIDGYLCVITDAANGDRFRFQLYQDGTLIPTDVHLGGSGETSDLEATLTFNSGNGADAYEATIQADGDGNLVYTTDLEHQFSGDIHGLNDLDIDGNANVDVDLTVGQDASITRDLSVGRDADITGDLTVDGYATLGDTADDHLVVNSTIYSDLNPDDCAYQLGDDDNRWIDGYFCFEYLNPPANYTPVGSDYSLEGHLRGIDAALASVSLQPERGVYRITVPEATADELDSSRAADQGQTVDVSGFTDAQFRDYIYIYLNGQLLRNDTSSAATTAAVQNDVARQTGSLTDLLFSGNIRKGDVVQIVDMS